jgi:hypothetical protein
VRSIVRTAVAGLWLLGAACSGGSPQDALGEANEKLAASDWAGAVAAASRGLEQKGGDPGVRWQLELVRLEAQARGGNGAEARLQIQRLAAEYPPQVDAGMYVTTAERLGEAGDDAGAIRVLEAGLERWPTDPELVAARARRGPVSGEDPTQPPAEGEEVPAPVGGGEEGAGAEEEAAAPPAAP